MENFLYMFIRTLYYNDSTFLCNHDLYLLYWNE